MNRSTLLFSLVCVAALSACQRTDPAPPSVVIQSVPGPAGPTGATGTQGATGTAGTTGATGMPGFDGSKGEAGKPGQGTVVIVTPPATPASAPAN